MGSHLTGTSARFGAGAPPRLHSLPGSLEPGKVSVGRIREARARTRRSLQQSRRRWGTNAGTAFQPDSLARRSGSPRSIPSALTSWQVIPSSPLVARGRQPRTLRRADAPGPSVDRGSSPPRSRRTPPHLANREPPWPAGPVWAQGSIERKVTDGSNFFHRFNHGGEGDDRVRTHAAGSGFRSRAREA
jgi:hypothetical protein